ncbi:MAG TPA: hypothetical protein VI168_11965 [Croceibacterium sp.]
MDRPPSFTDAEWVFVGIASALNYDEFARMSRRERAELEAEIRAAVSVLKRANTRGIIRSRALMAWVSDSVGKATRDLAGPNWEANSVSTAAVAAVFQLTRDLTPLLDAFESDARLWTNDAIVDRPNEKRPNLVYGVS